jgi:hypothetical protein
MHACDRSELTHFLMSDEYLPAVLQQQRGDCTVMQQCSRAVLTITRVVEWISVIIVATHGQHRLLILAVLAFS